MTDDATVILSADDIARVARPDGLVFVNSVGIGVQDAAAAEAIVEAARTQGLGTRVRL